jgi:hypothetical protein
MKMRRGLAIAAAHLLSFAALAAEDSVARFRLAADASNVTNCKVLDAVLGRPHTITVNNGDVEITSAGGIEGRMGEVRAGIYSVVFELSGRQLDVVADLSAAPTVLTVSERQFGCKWQANPER